MFYIREINGMLGPYQPGVVRRNRVVDPISAVSPAGPVAATALRQSPRPNTEPALKAYERVIHQDTPRRRVLFVGELMSKELVTISEDAKLFEASKLFADRRFRHIPVLDAKGELVGILSDRDLLRYAVHKNWQEDRVKKIMSSPVLVASEDTEMREVARVMFEDRIGCMPIVSSDGELVGIITRSDVLRTLLVQAPLELWR